MKLNRRVFVGGTAGFALWGAVGCAPKQQETSMFGLIGRMTAAEGKRDELISILLNGTANLSGCLSYIVSRDASDQNVIWITEVWESKAHHTASLQTEPVQEAIAKGRPLIAGMEMVASTEPVGGNGL